MPPTRTRARSQSDPKPKARNDVYVGLLLISFLAMVAGTVLLYMDFSQFPEGGPKKPPELPRGAAAQPGPGLGQPTNPVPPPGNNPMPPPGNNPMPAPMP